MANFENFEDAVADFPGVIKNSDNSTVRRSQRVAGKMVYLTTEQCKELLASVSHPDARPRTFSSCTARYNGERDPSKIEHIWQRSPDDS